MSHPTFPKTRSVDLHPLQRSDKCPSQNILLTCLLTILYFQDNQHIISTLAPYRKLSLCAVTLN